MPQNVSTHKALGEWRLYLFIVPALAAVLTFSYFPAASALYHSFFDWSGGDTKEFIGLGNFKRIATDTIFWQSFITIFILVVANVFKLIPSIGDGGAHSPHEERAGAILVSGRGGHPHDCAGDRYLVHLEILLRS